MTVGTDQLTVKSAQTNTMNQFYKTIPLLPHQKRIVQQNPKKAILNWEMRVGKTLPGCHWIDHPCRAGNTYIITPLSNYKDWVAMGTNAKVLTKDSQFKNEVFNKPTAIVIDEAHYFAAALFVKKGKGRSQMATKLYHLVKDNPDMDILLLTATPIRQDAWSLHTLLCYIGQYFDWKKWREEFFHLEKARFIKKIPGKWTPDEVFVKNSTWRDDVQKYKRQYCDIVALSDIKKDLPEPKIEVVKIKHPKYVKPTDEIVTWVHEHRHEQSGKAEYILSLGFKKIIIVVKYTSQIDKMVEELGDEKPIFVLDGRTKDKDLTKKQAQEADECYFIVQSSMGFAFDGYMFGAMVFASMAHTCVDHTQMVGRLTHLEHYNAFNYFYLIGGRWDRAIYNTVSSGNDFDYNTYGITGPTETE